MRHLTYKASGLKREEYDMLAELTTPIKIQNFLDALPMNYEKEGGTCRATQSALRAGKAHCIEGAMIAATALWIQGESPRIMNLSARLGRGDTDHVIAIYKRDGRFGAISKTNHAVLRFRDPIYRSLRELAASYFNEWFLFETGEKTLECYSRLLSMRRFGTSWITHEDNFWKVSDALADIEHFSLVPKGGWCYVRPADAMELKAGSIAEWSKSDPRT